LENSLRKSSLSFCLEQAARINLTSQKKPKSSVGGIKPLMGALNSDRTKGLSPHNSSSLNGWDNWLIEDGRPVSESVASTD